MMLGYPLGGGARASAPRSQMSQRARLTRHGRAGFRRLRRREGAARERWGPAVGASLGSLCESQVGGIWGCSCRGSSTLKGTGLGRTPERHDTIGEDRRGQERTGRGRSGQGGRGHGGRGQERRGEERTGQDGTGRDGTGQDRTGKERT